MSSRAPAAAGGLVFSLLSVAALAVLPPPPKADAAAHTVRHYFDAHSGTIRAASAVSIIGALALLLLCASLKRRLESTAGDALFAAGTVTASVSILGSALQAGLANAHTRLSDDGLLTFFSIERVTFYVTPAVTVALVGAAAAVAFRGRMPVWLVGWSAALGAVAVIGGVINVVDESTAGGGLGLVGFIMTIVWSAASAIALMRQGANEPRSDPALSRT